VRLLRWRDTGVMSTCTGDHRIKVVDGHLNLLQKCKESLQREVRKC
jgi:hypothetical protein